MCFCLILLIHYNLIYFLAINAAPPRLDILPYIAFNGSISTVVNNTGGNHLSNSWKVNAPRPIPLLGSTYSSIYVSLL